MDDQSVINGVINEFDCNLLRTQMLECYDSVGRSFFKKSKLAKCNKLRDELQFCLVKSNSSRLTNLKEISIEDKYRELFEKRKRENTEKRIEVISEGEKKERARRSKLVEL